MDRRDFFKNAGAGFAAAGLALSPRENAAANAAIAQLTEKARFERIASCSYPIRSLFKSRGGGGRGAAAPATPPPAGAPPPGGPQGTGPMSTAEMKAKYGEITMLDFPKFTKDTFPGVWKMDLFSSLFGDVTDDSMFAQGRGFDPMSTSGRRWLDELAKRCETNGCQVQHISNNAPTNLASLDTAQRKEGVEIAKRWLDGLAVLNPRSMRMNSVTALGPPVRPNAIPRSTDGYPRNTEIEPMLAAAIESYKEMADHGGKYNIKVTFENHWGLAADPMNIRIMVDAVNHPYCEASPDFCNWEHEYMLVSGLKALAPYSHTNVHAKYWDRWGDKNDVQRGVRIMLAGGFKGTFALEYEAGPLNGVEGAKYLYREVLAALTATNVGTGD
jgi:sugar phosphate isomerase/epimerase